MFKRLACHIYFIKKIGVKEKPNQGVVILEEKQRGSMGSLAFWALFLDWAYFSILSFLGLVLSPGYTP
jgi:hypothetical protein